MTIGDELESRNLKGIIFDLDDTLYLEYDYVCSGFRAVSRHIAQLESNLTGQAVYELLLETFHAYDRTKVFDTVLKKLGQNADQQIIQELVMKYRCHRPTLDLPQGSKTILEKLSAKFKLGLITDGTLPGQRLKVESLGIEQYFDSIIYTETLGRQYWKPSLIPFKKTAEALQLNHEDLIYIGDNPEKDFVALNQLGWYTLQIKRSNQTHSDKRVANNGAPCIIVSNLVDALSVLF